MTSLPPRRTGFTRLMLLMAAIVAVLGAGFLWFAASPRTPAPPPGYSTAP